MKMIKNRLFIAILLFSVGSNIQSMEPEKRFPFADLPLEMQHYVVALMSVSSTAQSLGEATEAISALSVTNKELHELLNDPMICFKIIKNLAQQFGCSDQEAAEALDTQEAKKRLDIQQQFFNICDQAVEDFTQADFNALYETYKEYVDFNFTYYTDFQQERIETTLLMLAIRAENCPLIKILLTYGADVNYTDVNGYTLLMVAVDTEKSDIVTCLLENSQPNIDQQDSEGLTALMSAVQKNNCPIIRELLKHGADINKVDDNGRTALMVAAMTGHTEAVQCLLQNSRIAINQKDIYGLTALMYAVTAEQNNCPMIELFLRYGADINQADDTGVTALIIAISVQKMNAFECLVYNRKIAIDQANKKGRSPLMMAVAYRNCPMIKILLERGADANKGDVVGMSAFMLAAYSGYAEVVQCLLKNAHVAINQRSEEGFTALMFAVTGQGDNSYIITMLLNHGADIDQKDTKWGMTALMTAIRNKNKAIIELLLNAGANPELADDMGTTPLQLAEDMGDQEIINLVKNAIEKKRSKK